jgi:hypothetical protein
MQSASVARSLNGRCAFEGGSLYREGLSEMSVVETLQTIEIARDFSRRPGGRYAKLGPNSGEAFRRVLAPAVRDAIENAGRLVILLDGAAGYPVSFLEEAFGGLVRVEGFAPEDLRQVLDVRSERFQPLVSLIWDFIEGRRH